jgi:MerR family transcriptional regulator, mercuric resistance operon regulatory protein
MRLESYAGGDPFPGALMMNASGTPVLPQRQSASLLKIGQVASRAGITARNLRFYADAGLFGELPRSPKGYRLFPAEAVQWVQILQASQAAGFSLEEIQELLRVLRQDAPPCGQVREALGTKLHALETRLADIKRLVDILRITLGTPDGQSSKLGCNLMETLVAEAKRLPVRAHHPA